MPTYDYACQACGTFEVYQGIKETPLAACPTCGGPVRRKIGTGGGLLFKGSGFYVTDYRSEGYRQKEKADTGGGTPAAESKPAADKPADSGSQPSAQAGTPPAASPSTGSSTPPPSSPSAPAGGSSGGEKPS